MSEFEFDFGILVDSGFATEDAGSRRRPGVAFGAVLAMVAAFGLAAGSVSPAEAQGAGPGAEAMLGQDTARVGDVVPVGVRVVTGPGERVAWPDTLPLGGVAAENASRVYERVDTLADGRVARTGVYGVTPWRTGELALPEVVVEVVGGDESPRSVRAAVPSLVVVTVLPPDTTAAEPKPARGVLGASWDWAALAFWALLLAVMLGGLFWWWRGRRGEREEPRVEPAPRIPPRERALAALQEAREAGHVERGEWKAFYTRVSEALRAYAAALNGAWGEDLTTTELLTRFRAQVGPGEAVTLGEVLRPADQVKFARREPDADAALAEWEAARAWVRGFTWPPPREVPEEAA